MNCGDPSYSSSSFSKSYNNSNLSSFLQRSDSIKSEQSDQSSECRRVSFNHDVQVKRIPNQSSKLFTNHNNKVPPAVPPKPSHILLSRVDSFEAGPFAKNVKKESPPVEKEQVAEETERILRQLKGVECKVNPTLPPPIPPPPSSNNRKNFSNDNKIYNPPTASSSSSPSPPPPPSEIPLVVSCDDLKKYNNCSDEEEEDDSGLPVSSSGGDQSSMQIGDSLSSCTSETTTTTATRVGNIEDNSVTSGQLKNLFGLHALNNLDIAVNGNKVNSMKSYQDLRRQTLDSSGNSAEYSPPPSLKRNNYNSNIHNQNNILPTPPKPPRKAPSASPPSVRRSISGGLYSQQNSQMVNNNNNYMDQLRQDERFQSRNNDLAETSDAGTFYSTTSRRRQNLSPLRISPSRTCMTDTEILKSPTEVLYAVSDKYKHNNNNNNERVVHSASQTMQSELQQQKRPQLNNQDPRYNGQQRMSKSLAGGRSREDLLSDAAARNGYDQPSHRKPRAYNPMSQSLDRNFIEDDKENAFKARIHVVSPDRISPSRHNRKPYKTTINTATDNIIQHRGHHGGEGNVMLNNKLYQKNQTYRKPIETLEHYKVPKNKAPVEYYRNGSRSGLISDSDQSYYQPNNNGNGRFNSTRLVKNVEHGRRQLGSRELDREGRTIRKERGRTYSGCSTSPDREGTPDRNGYSRPKPSVRSYSNMYRSPSTSPSRPPRAKSSPGRELLSSMIRRVTPNRREAERAPSTRAMATSRSPIKEIKRVQNDFRTGRGEVRNKPYRNEVDDSDARLAKFTEYRGDVDSGQEVMDHDNESYAYDEQRAMEAAEDQLARERGRSLPPGANIDSMRDFYKSSQFKSMYALPPSPSRPAPVLDRAPSSSTLLRQGGKGNPVQLRSNRVVMSEGDVTDGTLRQQRLRNTNSKFHNGLNTGKAPQPPVRRASSKRQAPSPPGQFGGGGGVRRVVSSDREDRHVQRMDLPVRRAISSDKGLQQQPPYRKMVSRKQSLGDTLDSSMSESEGFFAEPDKPNVHRRWTSHQSDMDSDYRREMATNGGLHQEARTRGDGGGGGQQSVRNRSNNASPVGRSSSSAREEERRKVLEIEEERIKREREAQLRKGNVVGRSNSRVSRGAGGPGGPLIKGRNKHLVVDDQDSLYSGHSSSSALRTDPPNNFNNKLNRFDQSRIGRVKRSTSNAHKDGGVGGIRKKIPGSVTSSLNSSESENRNQNDGQRSVYLHSACVADIPPNADAIKRAAVTSGPPPRALSAESRQDLSSVSGGGSNAQGPASSNLQKSKKISRSISLLAPWKPKPAPRQFSEIHYNNSGIYGPGSTAGKPPRPPVAPARRTNINIQRDKKSASSSDLLRDEGVVTPGPPPPNLIIQEQHTMPRNAIPTKVSRSVSMPKDTRLAGWFKRKKRL